MHINAHGPHLRNDLYCVKWDVKLYYSIPYHTIHHSGLVPQTSQGIYATNLPNFCLKCGLTEPLLVLDTPCPQPLRISDHWTSQLRSCGEKVFDCWDAFAYALTDLSVVIEINNHVLFRMWCINALRNRCTGLRLVPLFLLCQRKCCVQHSEFCSNSTTNVLSFGADLGSGNNAFLHVTVVLGSKLFSTWMLSRKTVLK